MTPNLRTGITTLLRLGICLGEAVRNDVWDGANHSTQCLFATMSLRNTPFRYERRAKIANDAQGPLNLNAARGGEVATDEQSFVLGHKTYIL